MARYLVERTFSDRLSLPPDAQGVESCRTIIANNADNEVTWIHSYVTNDKQKTYCIYDGPSPEAIRRSAALNGLPVDRQQSRLGSVSQPIEAAHLLLRGKKCQGFGQHCLGRKEPPPIVAQEAAAAGMQWVLLVKQADEEARVNDDASHGRTRGSAAGGMDAPRSKPV